MATDFAATPSLETGDNGYRDEFLAIWEQLPDVKRAELIGGIVCMPSLYEENMAPRIADIGHRYWHCSC